MVDVSSQSVAARLHACQADGFGFGEALALLDGLFLEGDRGNYKLSYLGGRHVHGVDLVKIPHFGNYIEMPITHTAANARSLK